MVNIITTKSVKIDTVLADILTENRKENGILPSVQLNRYLQESPSYLEDLKIHTTKKIKTEVPQNAS